MGWFIMSRGKPNKRYTPEFKKLVVETMMEEKLSYCETARWFEVSSTTQVRNWERIYLSERSEVLAIERRQHKTLVVQKLRQKYSLNLLLSIAQLPRATFYYHLKRMQKTDKYASVMEEITTIFTKTRADTATGGLRQCCAAEGSLWIIRPFRDLWRS